MKVESHHSILYRTPQFPINASLEESWSELKESIRLASPYFYGIIKDLDADQITTQTESIQFTIAKYFNRAKFRATPYNGLYCSEIANLQYEHFSNALYNPSSVSNPQTVD